MARHLYAGVSFGTIVALRCYQAAGLAFLFVPISTVAYVGLPQRKFNQASGMINLARNLGGDMGIAATTTILATRTQLHQTNLVAHTSRFDRAFTDRLTATTRAIAHAGYGAADASKKALGGRSRALDQQAQALAYVDVIWLLAFLAVIMIPLCFLMKKNEPGKTAAAA